MEPENSNSFLTEEPIKLLKTGQFKDLPWLVSLCKDEGLYRAAGNFFFLVRDDFNLLSISFGQT